MTKINEIVIVGGGSAGWMTASILIKSFPDIKISLVESPDIPVVGVGESTLGGINEYMQYLGIKDEDFMVATDASYKMSIKFTDFYDVDSGYFHYPFGHPYLEGTNQGLVDWMIKKRCNKDIPVKDFVDSYFPAASLFENNKYSDNKDGAFDNFYPKLGVAYHFDALKFGSWLKNNYCIPRGVNYISGTVVDASAENEEINFIVLDSGEKITADLFVDCTGFKSLLLGQSLKEEFIDYGHLIPNDSAWATRIPYKDKDLELEPFTNSTAHNNGWVWNIPLWSRLGSGYVYSSKHISDDDALSEYKEYLQSKKMVVPRSKQDIDELEFRKINMRIGIHKRTFVGNVVAIGLSAGFIEPLESNGLFSVHTFLFSLIRALENKNISQWDRDSYNYYTNSIFRSLAEFISLHYSLSIRENTQYWVDNRKRSYLDELNNENNQSIFLDLVQYKNGIKDLRPMDAINYIAVGMNHAPIDDVAISISEIHNNVFYEKDFKYFMDNLEKNKDRWSMAAKNCPSLYEYLKNNIYGDINEGIQ